MEKRPEKQREEAIKQFDRLLTIMDELREKCPWDRKQTLESLRHLTIEETFELSDAILEGDMAEIQKELGDLALHLVFYAKIASEQNQSAIQDGNTPRGGVQSFDIADVLQGICEKLIRRHPHVYGDVNAEDAAAVERNWEQIKLKEKGNAGRQGAAPTVLGGVPSSLPSLIKALRIQEKASGVGFDWENKEQVWDKVREEMEEFRAEEQAADPQKMQEEFGDLLFSLVNYARFAGINPEEALERTNKKFIQRFNYVEAQANKAQKSLQQMSLEEMDRYWNEAKGK